MEQKTLTVTERKEFKKGAARRLRADGKIPAIVYGSKEPLNISVDAHAFMTGLRNVSENTIIQLVLGKKKIDVLLKDLQDDILTDMVKHIDFYEIEMGKILKTHVPIHIIGSAIGVREGGNLESKLDILEVECLPKDMPKFFEVNIDELNMGDSIHVGDIAAIDGVKILDDPTRTVLVVTHPVVEVVEETDEDDEDAVEGDDEAAAAASEESTEEK